MNLQSNYINADSNLLPPIETLLSDNSLGLGKSIVKNQKEHFNYANSEDGQGVVDSLKKLIELDSSPRNYSLLALAYYKVGELNKAANMLEKAIKLDSTDSKIQFFLSVIYILLGKLTKAITILRTSIRLNPKEARAHFCLGFIHHKLKHWKLAIDSYKEAISLNEKFISSYLYLANLYLSLGNEKDSKRDDFFNEAIAVYKQLLEIDGKHIGALNGLGELYHSLGRLEEAEKVLEKALKLDPDNAGALNLLRMVKEDQLAQMLFESGSLKRINKRITDFTPYQKRKPIKIKGKPLSETVIEDRR